jgi:hypothetical protein
MINPVSNISNVYNMDRTAPAVRNEATEVRENDNDGDDKAIQMRKLTETQNGIGNKIDIMA